MSFVACDIQEGIALVTIDRPKVNALNNDVIEELSMVFSELSIDDDVAVVILTGAGEKAFVAGADIKELSELNALEAKEQSEMGQSVFDQLENMPKPVIAAVNGFALGGGCELALACHVRVASDNALFGLPEVGLGLIPGYGGTQRLPRLVGKGHALEIMLTGEPISAARAAQIGLVNHVVPQDQLLNKAREIAGKMKQRGPVALRLAIDSVNRGMDIPLERGLEVEAGAFGVIASTEDAKEGLRAFLEKRQPQFKGA